MMTNTLKMFWNMEHYKVHVPTGDVTNVSTSSWVSSKHVRKIQIKARKCGARYNRATHEYVWVQGDFEHHLKIT